MSEKSKDAAVPADARMEEENLRGGGETGEGSGDAQRAGVTEERQEEGAGGEEGERAEEGKKEKEKQNEEGGKKEEKKTGGKGTANSTHSPFLSCFCIKTTSEISSLFTFSFEVWHHSRVQPILLSSTSPSILYFKSLGLR